KALASVLKDDGALGLMLYAPYGREGVYQMQALMRYMNGSAATPQEAIENCKATLGVLPESNAFKRSRRLFNDIELFGDAGMYDLLLHSQDRAYSVSDVYELLAPEGLKPIKWLGGD